MFCRLTISTVFHLLQFAISLCCPNHAKIYAVFVNFIVKYFLAYTFP